MLLITENKWKLCQQPPVKLFSTPSSRNSVIASFSFAAAAGFDTMQKMKMILKCALATTPLAIMKPRKCVSSFFDLLPGFVEAPAATSFLSLTEHLRNSLCFPFSLASRTSILNLHPILVRFNVFLLRDTFSSSCPIFAPLLACCFLEHSRCILFVLLFAKRYLRKSFFWFVFPVGKAFY